MNQHLITIKQKVYCFEHILLNYSNGSEKSYGNLQVPLLIYNNVMQIIEK